METSLMLIPKEADDISGLSTLHASYIIHNLIPLSVLDKEKLTLIDKILIEEKEEISMFVDDVTVVAVGSSAEGLNMPNLTECTAQGLRPLELSDLDILFVMNQYTITFQESLKQTITFCDARELFPWEFYAVAETADIPPGYVRLNRSDINLLSEHQDRGMILLNFQMYHMQRKEFVDAVEVNGPALTIPVDVSDRKINGKRVPLDKVLAMPCKEWPPTANACLKRFEDKGWLPKDLISEIKNGGCHIVPVHHKGGGDRESKIEWRISFATSERLIARTALTDVQKQAYVAIKALYHQKVKKLEILSSYHMKTIFFYTCERIPESYWNENIYLCILFFLDLLIECVVKRNIPNFFIPENNLIDYVTIEQIRILEETLTEMRLNPLYPLLSFFDDKYFDKTGTKIDNRAIFAPVLSDMEKYLNHHNIEFSLEIFRSCSMAIMIKYIENKNYRAAVETAKCLNLFLLKCKKSNFDVESLTHFVSSMAKDIGNQESVMDFFNYITECLEGSKQPKVTEIP